MNRRHRSFLYASLGALALPAGPALAHCGEALGLWHPDFGFSADFAAPVALIGLWRPGGGEVIPPEPAVPATDLACPQGVACLIDQPADGRSIRDFERYTVGSAVYYTLAFSGVEQEEKLLTGITSGAALETEVDDQLQLGFHLADFETHLEATNRRWEALFQEGVADQQLDLEMTGAELKARVEDAPAHGVLPHLADFEVLPFGSPRYAALFDSDTTPQQFFPNLSVEEFHRMIHALRLDGYYLTDVETWVAPIAADIRFAALFEAARGDDHLYVMACDRNTFDCDDPDFSERLDDYLVAMTVKMPDEKPLLRLTDIEVARGVPGIVISSFAGGGEAPATRQRRQPSSLLDPPIFQVPPGCTHAGILHDSGTNGPP